MCIDLQIVLRVQKSDPRWPNSGCSVSNGCWEGHDFSLAVKSLKMCSRFCAQGMLLVPGPLLQPKAIIGTCSTVFTVEAKER